MQKIVPDISSTTPASKPMKSYPWVNDGFSQQLYQAMNGAERKVSPEAQATKNAIKDSNSSVDQLVSPMNMMNSALANTQVRTEMLNLYKAQDRKIDKSERIKTAQISQESFSAM